MMVAWAGGRATALPVQSAGDRSWRQLLGEKRLGWRAISGPAAAPAGLRGVDGAQQEVGRDGLREVLVEAGLAREAQRLGPLPAGEGDQHHAAARRIVAQRGSDAEAVEVRRADGDRRGGGLEGLRGARAAA